MGKYPHPLHCSHSAMVNPADNSPGAYMDQASGVWGEGWEECDCIGWWPHSQLGLQHCGHLSGSITIHGPGPPEQWLEAWGQGSARVGIEHCCICVCVCVVPP